jgi:hypothetical protein
MLDRTPQLKAGVGRSMRARRMKNLLFSVVLIAGAVFLSGCLNLGSDTSRDVNVIASLTSPNQSYVATSFNRSGGGAAGWCYVYVNVRKQSENFNSDSGVVFQTRCDVTPDLKWESDKKLSIGYPFDATVYTQEKAWRSGEDMEISYVPK